MIRFRNFLIIALTVSGLLLAGCEGNEPENTTSYYPELTFSTTEVSASSNGGYFSISYTVVNPTNGGAVSCSSGVTWISDFDTSTDGTVSFNVAKNTSEDSRTGKFSVFYTYTENNSRKNVEQTVSVSQDGNIIPSLSVSPETISVSADGGEFSLHYSVTNAVTGGGTSCTADADWIGDFDYSSYGEIAFSVAANEANQARTAEITVTYRWDDGETSCSVAVTQNPDDADHGITVNDVIGTYKVSGYVRTAGSVIKSTWGTRITQSYGNNLQIDSLSPHAADRYAESSVAYVANAYLTDEGQIVVPSQFTGYIYAYYYGGYIAWTPCLSYTEDGQWIRSDDAPDCTLTYDAETDTWTSDYGEILGLYYAMYDFTSYYSYFDMVAPGFTLQKLNSSIE